MNQIGGIDDGTNWQRPHSTFDRARVRVDAQFLFLTAGVNNETNF